MPAEDDSPVRGSQPLDAKLLRRKQNSETLWIPSTAEMREDINVEETKRQLADAADGECPQCAHLRDWPRGPKGEN